MVKVINSDTFGCQYHDEWGTKKDMAEHVEKYGKDYCQIVRNVELE